MSRDIPRVAVLRMCKYVTLSCKKTTSTKQGKKKMRCSLSQCILQIFSGFLKLFIYFRLKEKKINQKSVNVEIRGFHWTVM